MQQTLRERCLGWIVGGAARADGGAGGEAVSREQVGEALYKQRVGCGGGDDGAAGGVAGAAGGGRVWGRAAGDCADGEVGGWDRAVPDADGGWRDGRDGVDAGWGWRRAGDGSEAAEEEEGELGIRGCGRAGSASDGSGCTECELQAGDDLYFEPGGVCGELPVLPDGEAGDEAEPDGGRDCGAGGGGAEPARRAAGQRRGVETPARINLVFMGMGEPFLNYDAFMKSVHLLRRDGDSGVADDGVDERD